MAEYKTTEFSFILKPSEYGIGVFAVQDIPQGTYLRLFGEGDNLKDRSVIRDKDGVPKIFQDYCMARGEDLICPNDFGQMAIGWYLNHSTNPNAYHKNYNWYAARNISMGEEIFIDYNSLEEPKEFVENYYNS